VTEGHRGTQGETTKNQSIVRAVDGSEGFSATMGLREDRGLYIGGQRAIEGTEGRRGDKGPLRGQRAVEGIEGRRGNIGP
jgi:hypothetical protein